MPDCSLLVTTLSKHSWPLQRIATRVTSMMPSVGERYPVSRTPRLPESDWPRLEGWHAGQMGSDAYPVHHTIDIHLDPTIRLPRSRIMGEPIVRPWQPARASDPRHTMGQWLHCGLMQSAMYPVRKKCIS